MNRTLHLSITLCALLCTSTALAQSSDEQLRKLSAQIEKLEQRVQALEQQSAEQVTAAAAVEAQSNDPWQNIKIGMSYEEVEKVLGKPTEVQRGMAEYWFYSDKRREGPYLKFLFSKLDSWKAP